MATKHRQSVVVTKDEDSYIPEYTLDRIEEEVCKKMPAFIQYADWKKVIPTCIMIEQEPLGIYGCLINTIKEATKNMLSGTSYTRVAIKYRIYMLLYYRHRDNELYKVAVFPNLIEKMREEKFDYDIDWINKCIDHIIDLEREVRELQKRSSENMTEEGSEETKWHDKVRLELTLRIMESMGADLKKYGNKVKVASILQTITNLPLSTCKNYVTNRDLNSKEHSEEVLKINSTLQEISLDIRL